MAYQFRNSRSRLSGGARVGLLVLLFWLLAVPVVYLLRSTPVQADQSEEPFGDGPAVATQARVAIATEFVPLPIGNEKKIADELEKSTNMDFQETPLTGVVDYLKNLHQIEIQLDSKALRDAGVDPETQLTKTLKDISLRSALRLLLAPHELTTIIEDEVLLITTTEKASTCLVTRAYPVGDLVESDKYGDLINALTETVKPLTWEEGGGEGRLSTMKSLKSLVISQTQEVHDEILRLLRALRTVRRAPAVARSAK
jgi:hypothetical protein